MGRWWLPLSPSHGESCESMFVCGSSVHQKCYNYALTNLLFGLCRSMWIIDLLVIRPNPHHEAPTCPSTLKVWQARECAPTPYPFVVFTFGLGVQYIKEFGGVSSFFTRYHLWKDHLFCLCMYIHLICPIPFTRICIAMEHTCSSTFIHLHTCSKYCSTCR
jgi:hypothetical protein